MAEQKKRGFHAFEDRVHQIEEQERQQEPSPREGKDAGAERGGAREDRDEPAPRK